MSGRLHPKVFNGFAEAARASVVLSRSFGEDLFRLLALYTDISASEAASRLTLHIKTVQDALEDLHDLGICERREAQEGRRPYFSYRLVTREVRISVNLRALKDEGPIREAMRWRIREKSGTGVVFTSSRKETVVAAVAMFSGSGREREVRTLQLTETQGRVLYHLPLPAEAPMSVRDIIRKAGLRVSHQTEIADMLLILHEQHVLDVETDGEEAGCHSGSVGR